MREVVSKPQMVWLFGTTRQPGLPVCKLKLCPHGSLASEKTTVDFTMTSLMKPRKNIHQAVMSKLYEFA